MFSTCIVVELVVIQRCSTLWVRGSTPHMNTERTTECYTEVDLMYREVYNMHTWRSNWLLYRGASHIHKCTCTYTQKGEVVAI